MGQTRVANVGGQDGMNLTQYIQVFNYISQQDYEFVIVFILS